MEKILRAKPIRDQHTPILAKEVEGIRAAGIIPSLKIVLVGENSASQVYVRNKKTFAESINASCEIIKLPESITESEFLRIVKEFNGDDNVHGILVQLPVPKQLSHIDMGSLIPPHKDVDGLHYLTGGKILYGDEQDALLPCTPKGILTLLDHYDIPIAGKKVTIIGRSHIVGRPIAQLMLNRDATVSICHSKTPDIKSYTKDSDIIIVAVGREKFLTKDFLSNTKAPYIIDVGINVDENGKLCGDVDFDEVKDLTSGITPVPGGVGPLTIFSLAQNLISSAKKYVK